MPQIKSVLFVCTGNTCRSPMAEGFLKKLLLDAKRIDVSVRSAGINALDGQAPTAETIMVMTGEGIDLSGHRSQHLAGELIKSSDLILAMEEYHKNRVIQLAPDAASKIYLLKEYGAASVAKGLSNPDVADPIGRTLEDYGIRKDEIKQEIERIRKYI